MNTIFVGGGSKNSEKDIYRNIAKEKGQQNNSCRVESFLIFE